MIKLEELSYNGNIVLTIKFDENDKSIVLVDEHKNTVRLGANGISLVSNTDINISAGGNIKIEGGNIAINAQMSLAAKGSATAELSASGQTTVKGAIVMIN
jgi:hypothetical protein